MGSRNGGIRNLSMKKFGTPTAAGPTVASETVGLLGVGVPFERVRGRGGSGAGCGAGGAGSAGGPVSGPAWEPEEPRRGGRRGDASSHTLHWRLKLCPCC